MLLKKAENQTAYLKCGILGFAGSGKTFTAGSLAIGLAKHTKSKKPVAFFDTETGSDFLIPRFKEAGVELLVLKSRAFKDLKEVMKEAEANCSSIIIDSISHVWGELVEAYKKKLRRNNGLYFQDWAEVKSAWREFTDLYLNTTVHAFLCGRAGYEYDFDQNETGKKELIKTGVKMKAETEMGYEPSLLLQMERVKIDMHKTVNRAYITKDRTNTMNGQFVDNPDFKDFMPVINFINLGGKHLGVNVERNSQDLFKDPDNSGAAFAKRRDIAVEELEATLVKLGYSGQSQDVKAKRVTLLERVFGTASKTKIESLSPEKLESGIAKIIMEDDFEKRSEA